MAIFPAFYGGAGVMLVAGFIAKRRGYVAEKNTMKGQAFKLVLDAVPSLMMIVVAIGGILGGIFTATEASSHCSCVLFNLRYVL